MKTAVLGIGSAHVDYFLKADQITFDSYVCFESRHLPLEEFNRLCKQSEKVLPGGSVANTIRGLAHFGVTCSFLSSVGNDAEGELFLSNLKQLGIYPAVSVDPAYSTVRLLCLIGPEGEKRILYPDQTEPRPNFNATQFQDVNWIHTDAFQFEIGSPLEQAMDWVQCKTSFSLGNAAVAAEQKEKILPFLQKHAEILFGNEEEITALTGLSADLGCRQLQTICPIVAMTRGPKGCLIASEKGVLSFPAFPASRIDATGAGDYFASAFLFGHLNGFPIEKCALAANRLGAAIIEVIGTELSEEKWRIFKNAIL